MSDYDEFGRDDHLGDPADPGAEPEPAMSTQQDAEAIREALETTSTGHAYAPYTAAIAALDRLTAALQRDDWKAIAEDSTLEAGKLIVKWKARAEKAERALAEIQENALSWHGPLTDTGHERALAVIATWADVALERKLSAVRFCAYCATGYIPNPGDEHKDSCAGCRRAEKAERALAEMRKALGAYRGALLSGERETPKLAALADAALAASTEEPR